MFYRSIKKLIIAAMFFSFFALSLLVIPSITREAQATTLPLGDAGAYAVLFTGGGSNNQLSVTNVTINGNVGVGGDGIVKFNGPGDVNGRLDFSSAPFSGQYSNTNGSNGGPSSVNYSVSAVTTALNTVDSLNSSLAGLGNNLVINTQQSGTQTVDESAGLHETINGVAYSIFNVTSYQANNGQMLTIVGDGTGDPVVFNFGSGIGNVNLGGDVTLSGLGDDQILWNFTSSGDNVQLNNNASSYPSLAFQGDILAPNDSISLTNANLDGRVLGGDSHNLQIVSGAVIDSPLSPSVPEPCTMLLFGSGLVGLVALRKKIRV
jgi:choice-of-anchor A domain-containing protein